MGRRFKTVKRVLRRPFEWLGITLGFLVLSSLPRKGLLAVCDFASAFMFVFDRKGRAHAHENLSIMFPGMDARRERKIVRRSYRNMARAVGHAFWTCRKAAQRAVEAGEMSREGAEFLAANKPAVTVSGHIGCWEILSQLAFLQGHSMMSVAKDIGSSAMTKLLMKARRSIGQEIVHAQGAFQSLMRGIKSGKSLGLLVDQRVSPDDGGIWVRFFGRPVPVSAAPAFFASRTKAPILVAWSRPLADGRYRCELLDCIAPEEAKDVWSATQRITHDLECVISRHPSRWVMNYNLFGTFPTPAAECCGGNVGRVERAYGRVRALA